MGFDLYSYVVSRIEFPNEISTMLIPETTLSKVEQSRTEARVSMTTSEKMNVPVLKILPKQEGNLNGELAEKTYSICDLCEKRVGLYSQERALCEKLTGDGSFYCGFCLRHRFNTRNNRDLLIMSFRGIIGYYYDYLYKDKGELSLSQIKDFIQLHRRVGLQNPIFYYDDESMLWFVDFSRVGRGRKKLQLKDVLQTTIGILSCFNLAQVVPDPNLHKLFGKYREAIEKFCSHRYRPEGRWLLIPTLSGCATASYPTTSKKKAFDFEASKEFSSNRLVMRR